MSTFEKLGAIFDVSWTTVLVGWNGLGVLSPWPDRWTTWPPLISAHDIAAYADKRLSRCSGRELDLTVVLVASGLQRETREEIKDLLTPLSKLDGGDPQVELRKWRLVLLEETLVSMPKDALHGLMALTEFWQSLGFPSDSPHVIQGRGNTITASEYYQEENLNQIITRHRSWIEDEKASLKEHLRQPPL